VKETKVYNYGNVLREKARQKLLKVQVPKIYSDLAYKATARAQG